MAVPVARTQTEFYIPAKGFAMAAQIAKESPLRLDREIATFLPVQTLLGFSVELYLKAWLMSAGVDEKTLRNKPYGHNLERLYAHAVEDELPRISRLDDLVDCLHEPHLNMTYRYFRSDVIYKVMDLNLVFIIMQSLDTEVDRRIGASASIGKAPGH